ncbi:DUF418 domain-containing protein [Kineococcus sp. NUM-3379]
MASAPPARLDGLDVARGVAILGTLATNIWLFTAPGGALGFLTAPDAAMGATGTVAAVLQQLPNGKSLALLTLLFGMGLQLQRDAALRRGQRWPGRYPWRALLLLLDGTLHYFLVAEFDVLMGYALTGLVVAWLLARGERAQRTWLVAAATWHVLVLGLLALLITLAPAGEEDPAQPPPGAGVYRTGSWWDLVVLRWDNLLLFRAEPVLIGALSVALFLLGARLLRAGLAAPGGARLRRRLLVLGAVALPVDLALGLAGGDAGLLLARYLTAPLVGLGLLAAVLGLCARRPAPAAGWARRRLAQVGRTALSCYVLQNVLASALCYGWGLDLGGRLDGGTRTPGTVALFVLVSAAVGAAAWWWTSRTGSGPLEALTHAALRRAPGGRDPRGGRAPSGALPAPSAAPGAPREGSVRQAGPR